MYLCRFQSVKEFHESEKPVDEHVSNGMMKNSHTIFRFSKFFCQWEAGNICLPLKYF